MWGHQTLWPWRELRGWQPSLGPGMGVKDLTCHQICRKFLKKTPWNVQALLRAWNQRYEKLGWKELCKSCNKPLYAILESSHLTPPNSPPDFVLKCVCLFLPPVSSFYICLTPTTGQTALTPWVIKWDGKKYIGIFKNKNSKCLPIFQSRGWISHSAERGKLRQKVDQDLTSKDLWVMLGCSSLELVLIPGWKWPSLEITLRTGAKCRNSIQKDFFLYFFQLRSKDSALAHSMIWLSVGLGVTGVRQALLPSLPSWVTQCPCSRGWVPIRSSGSTGSTDPLRQVLHPPCILCVCYAKLLQLCLTLCDPVDCNPPGSSVHGILQARILEWVAMPSSRGSSQPRDWTHVSCISCIGRHILYH